MGWRGARDGFGGSPSHLNAYSADVDPGIGVGGNGYTSRFSFVLTQWASWKMVVMQSWLFPLDYSGALKSIHSYHTPITF